MWPAILNVRSVGARHARIAGWQLGKVIGCKMDPKALRRFEGSICTQPLFLGVRRWSGVIGHVASWWAG